MCTPVSNRQYPAIALSSALCSVPVAGEPSIVAGWVATSESSSAPAELREVIAVGGYFTSKHAGQGRLPAGEGPAVVGSMPDDAGRPTADVMHCHALENESGFVTQVTHARFSLKLF